MKTFDVTLSKERGAFFTMYLNLESPEFNFTKRPLMIVLPGGGYAMHSERESEIIALQYMAAGYQACVLRYTLRDKAGWPYPLDDYDRTMEYISEHADEWNIDMDHVAVVGFSAGGHLAACAATLAKHKPRAAVCIYPAILPDIVDGCQPGMPYPHEHVDENTCPCFIAAARNDGVVNVNSSLVFAQALEKAGIDFELYVYATGDHGFSIGTPLMMAAPASTRVANWVKDSIGWLGEIMGALTYNGFAEPMITHTECGDKDPFLSVRCSIEHLRRQGETVEQMLGTLYTPFRKYCKANNLAFEEIISHVGGSAAKDIMEKLGIPAEQINKLNQDLSAIPNTLE